MPIFEITITRAVEEQTATVTVRAKNETLARTKASKEVKRNESQWFGPLEDSHLDITNVEKLDFVPDCEVYE